MRTRTGAAAFLLFGGCAILAAQVPQIPTLQVCNLAANMSIKSTPTAKVTILSRVDATHTGTFTVTVSMSCDANGYPTGSLVYFRHQHDGFGGSRDHHRDYLRTAHVHRDGDTHGLPERPLHGADRGGERYRLSLLDHVRR